IRYEVKHRPVDLGESEVVVALDEARRLVGVSFGAADRHGAPPRAGPSRQLTELCSMRRGAINGPSATPRHAAGLFSAAPQRRRSALDRAAAALRQLVTRIAGRAPREAAARNSGRAAA